jgi:tetratricopeptide (TPR) repeat protein/4-amino-4-deoxy-L-arabinose transferase-like glycosyltransferase
VRRSVVPQQQVRLPAPGRAWHTRRAQLSSIFVIALVARLVHLWQMRDAPVFSVLLGDSRSYDEWARRIAAGDWFGTDVFYQAPLYPYFLGTLYTVFGSHLTVVRICQAVIGASACALLSSTAGRLFGDRAGLVAGLSLALYAPAIFFDALIQKTVLDVFFVCLVLWILSRLVLSTGSLYVPLVLGLALGGLALTRENALVVAAVVLVWLAIRRSPDGSQQSLRTRALAAGACLAGFVIILAPVAARNYAVGGGLYVTTSQFGPNFYIGNNAGAEGTYMSLRPGRGAPEYERTDATEIAEQALGRPLTASEVSGYWTDRALEFITSQPAAWATLLGRKLLLLLNADEMPDTESLQTHAESSMLLRAGRWVGHFGVLIPLALLGIAATWPNRRRLAIFHAVALSYAASVVLFYVFARYRFPLVPMLMLFASAGVVEGLRLFRMSSLRRRTALTGAVAVAALVTNWPLLSDATMQAVTENNLGAALHERGRIDEAIAHYRRAVAFERVYAPAYNNMGTALRMRGELDQAVASYRQAIELMPDYADAHNNLATALLDQQRTSEAVRHLRIAARALPGSAAVRNNLGKALTEDGQLQEAEQELRRAVALDPRSAKAHHNLGNVLASRGRVDDALQHLRRAAEIDPADVEIDYDVGTLMLEAGRLEAAVVAFAAVLSKKPDHAEAHSNLGIALGSQGRLDDAIRQFEEALRLKPDFADARSNLDTARRVKQSSAGSSRRSEERR